MTQKNKSWLFYVIMLVVFILSAYLLIKSGDRFHPKGANTLSDTAILNDNLSNASDWKLFVQSIIHNIGEPFAVLLMQIIAILFVARIFGFLFIKIGQPTVIGEILAGIVLGPSLLGYFYPDIFEFLFPEKSMGNLSLLSQIGLILFMFVIGMELELEELKKRLNETFVISHASIIVPFFLGMVLSYFVYENYAIGNTSFLSFSLFIGISMSITAFPVLARIVQEKNLTKTHLGILSIASAANNDATAWCLLAVIIALAKTGTAISALYTIGFSIGYVLFMFGVVKPFLTKVGNAYQNKEVINKGIVAFIFLILILSSFTTQMIGIHALFGAFLAGVIMPANLNFRKIMTEKIEDISLVMLLPLFFVFTGLRTNVGLLNSVELWELCGLFIAVAIIGKFFGSAVPAKIIGESWRDSLSLGALMNARGLMELIVLNIGYEMKILPPTLFAILVLMALVTTFMTTPTISLINLLFPEKVESDEFYRDMRKKFNILLSFGRLESGRKLLDVAKAVFGNNEEETSITALHLTVGTDMNPILVEKYIEEGFKPILHEAERLKMNIKTRYGVTDDVGREIVNMVNDEKYDFLLVGAGISIFQKSLFKENPVSGKFGWLNTMLNKLNRQRLIFYPGELLKDKTKYFIEQTGVPVGVFVDRDFAGITSLMVLLYHPVDIHLLEYADSILNNNPAATVTISDANGLITSSPLVRQHIRSFSDKFEKRTTLLHKKRITAELLSKQNFMLVDYESWNIISGIYGDALQKIPSTLIISKTK
ncbi:MAG: cation:proton antiporter [Candidatus Azobacteroides sp.]|nr:cation:proton antiporter [Candidatus Azobacteroides sp.]